MLISLNWLREFVALPAHLDPRELAERFTLTCAEVEKVIALHPGDRTPAETVASEADWIFELDNKSITHRPDLWGHYGVAREMAAMLRLPLGALPVADGDRLGNPKLPEIPIEIDDARASPRYCGLLLSGVRSQPAPPWMQSRLAHVGIRPINAIVDLTNYVMAELGQPMHAFDGDLVHSIEVAMAAGGEHFTTLDGSARTVPAGAVMIQSRRRSLAFGGIMGGLETEVRAGTCRLLLESANFEASVIRRAAAALGLRTEASARFEKSLDPALAALAIARFVHLAEQQFPELRLESRLSDCFPAPPAPLSITIDPAFVCALIGKNISLGEMKDILQAIEFKIEDRGDHIEVLVPSFRATKDIQVEADIIEEIARFVGYGNITPMLPRATVRRFEPNRLQQIERRTADLVCLGRSFYEIHDYIWYHENWLGQLGYDPQDCIRLRNPPAHGCERLRRSVIPGLLKAAELNRRELPDVRLMSLGSVFKAPGGNRVARDGDGVAANGDGVDVLRQQSRCLGLLVMARSRRAEDTVQGELKATLEYWARNLFDRPLEYAPSPPQVLPWEDAQRTASVLLDGRAVGRTTTVPLELRRRIDEHLVPWSMAVAEVDLTALAGLPPVLCKPRPIPEQPEVALDFSVLVEAGTAYHGVRAALGCFAHPLLQRLSFEGSYEGKNLPPGMRSLLLRARIGSTERTLQDEDMKEFSAAFEKFLAKHDLRIRS